MLRPYFEHRLMYTISISAAQFRDRDVSTYICMRTCMCVCVCVWKAREQLEDLTKIGVYYTAVKNGLL